MYSRSLNFSYGLGANTALEDVQILHEILSATPNTSQNLDQAVQQFTKQRATDTRALVTISRGMDRPGKLGTMRFIIPLILGKSCIIVEASFEVAKD